MAEKTEKTVKKTDGKVTIRIPKVPGQKVQEDVVISIWGKRYQIQRGVDVSVPKEVAEAFALWQSERDEASRIEFELSET